MVTIEKSALVLFSAEQMYKLVNDVKSYPEFLDGCYETEVHEKSDSHMLASLGLKQGLISLQLTTRNSLIQNHSIHMQLENGPLKSLEGRWWFHPLGQQGCKVMLKLEFEVDNKLLGGGVSILLSKIGAQMVQAFSKRAEDIYG